MNKIYIPENYKPVLDAYDTQRAIAYIKETFQQEFSKALNLKRVSAPLFVTESSGLNDNLNGYERPVAFDIPAVGMDAQVVHSLAKWKRLALKRYNFTVGNGLYTDMNAIRRDEALDNIQSIYVDQWDWEKIITRENRNLDFLKLIVRAIVGAICDTNDRLHVRFPQLRTELSREVTFITAQELEDMYPGLETGSQRENAFVREHKTACIMQIGGLLRSGKPHDGRAPVYLPAPVFLSEFGVFPNGYKYVTIAVHICKKTERGDCYSTNSDLYCIGSAPFGSVPSADAG